MTSKLQLQAGLPGHPSLRPNAYETSTASHVSSNPGSTSEEKSGHRHKSHRHHRHHSSSQDRQNHHSSARRHARDVVQSAIQLQPPTSFGDLLKQARGSKDTSPSHSRKGSIAPGNSDGNAEIKENSNVGISIPPRRPLRPEDVELERRRVEVRERELRATLQSLSDQSLKTSRRLDDTYYSILEKVNVLRQTIGTLQELSGLTNELHENFESDTKELVEDVKGQFDNFENFDTQQQQIIDLEERMRRGKEKADTLTERLARAREHVDARAKTEAEWQTTNSRRLRYFWGTLGSIAAMIFALILFHQLKPIPVVHDPRSSLDFATRAKIMEAQIPDIAKEAIIGPTSNPSENDVPHRAEVKVPDDHESLRIFDEL